MWPVILLTSLSEPGRRPPRALGTGGFYSRSLTTMRRPPLYRAAFTRNQIRWGRSPDPAVPIEGHFRRHKPIQVDTGRRHPHPFFASTYGDAVRRNPSTHSAHASCAEANQELLDKLERLSEARSGLSRTEPVCFGGGRPPPAVPAHAAMKRRAKPISGAVGETSPAGALRRPPGPRPRSTIRSPSSLNNWRWLQRDVARRGPVLRCTQSLNWPTAITRPLPKRSRLRRAD